MKGFHSLSLAACKSAVNCDFDASLSYARQSLRLYPNNLVLILQLIKEFAKSHEGRARLLEIDELITDSLRYLGEVKSVFGYKDSISFLRLNILNTLHSHSSRHSTLKSLRSSPGSSYLSSEDISNETASFRMGILSCIWKRPRLSRIFLKHLHNLANEIKNEIELVPIIVGSDRVADDKVCSGLNVRYSFFSNFPLSRKWEHGLAVASGMDLDALIILGSDDFVSKSLLLAYKTLILSGVSLAGLPKAYFLNLNASPPTLILWNGYGSSAKCLGQPHRLGETIGMARVLSKSLLEKLDYSLWPGLELNKGLDYHSLRRMMGFGHLPVSFSHYTSSPLFKATDGIGQVCIELDDIDAFAVDIKYGDGNVTSFDKYVSCDCTHNIIDNPWNTLSTRLGEELTDRLKFLAYHGDNG